MVLLGAWGAGDLIAAACFTLARAREGQNFTCKLDSVIVRPEVRRQGLAGIIVAHGFQMILEQEKELIATIYAHSVHPATVKLLRRHAFSEPSPVGAPISALTITDDNRDKLITSLKTGEQGSVTRLKHKCVRCKSGRKGATAWCQGL